MEGREEMRIGGGGEGKGILLGVKGLPLQLMEGALLHRVALLRVGMDLLLYRHHPTNHPLLKHQQTTPKLPKHRPHPPVHVPSFG